MMQYRVYDLETENHTYYGRVASSFHPDNYVVAYGWQDRGDDKPKGIYCDSKDSPNHNDWYIPDHIDLLVGHNLKFDLLWIWNHPSTKAFIERGGKIWCTQLAEYILKAMEQKWQYASLNDCAAIRGGTCKLDAVKEMWESGMLTSEIPQDILMEYLLGGPDAGLGDIGNTHAVFLSQIKEAHERGLLATLQNRMESLLCTTEMEYNGLIVDVELGRGIAEGLQKELDDVDTALNASLPDDLPPELEFNWGSAYHASAILFGGPLPYTKWMPHLDEHGNMQYPMLTFKEPMLDAKGEPVLFKSGKNAGLPRMRNVQVPNLDKPKGAQQEFTYTFKGICKPLDEWAGKRTLRDGTPVYSTDKDTIDYLVAHRLGGDVPDLLRRRAKLDKDLGTYYVKYDAKKDQYTGMLTLVNDKGVLRGQLNHCATKTGRLSSSAPNLQNIPRGDTSEIKKVFKSRWGEQGNVIEIDYSQLEVIVQAALSRDPALCADVRAGVDFHCKRLAARNHEDYDEVIHKVKVLELEEYVLARTKIKGFTFQRAYGAGASAIAASTGMDIEEVETLITNEDLLYPGVAKLDAEVESSIMTSVKTYREQDPVRPYATRPFQKGMWQAPTGTTYMWRQWDAPAYLKRKGISMTFSPTERKNWPVQGTGGEIMQMTLGKLFREYVKRGWWSGNADAKALLVNTVHDCSWMDSHESVTEEVMDVSMQIFQDVPKNLLDIFGWEVEVPFRAEAEFGKNMYTLNHYKYKGVCPLAD